MSVKDLFTLEKERAPAGGGEEGREGERVSLKQVLCSAQILMWSSISKPRDCDLGQNQEPEPEKT